MIMNQKQPILPRKMRLESSTICQLKCPSCPTATGATGKKLGLGTLKFEHFKELVDKNPHISEIELSNWGEIFLNKDLIKILQYAYKHNIVLTAGNSTNLNNASEEVLEALVKYKFREMSCSVDGVTQETYAIYRIKGNVDNVLRNIRTINKYKAKYKSRYPKLKWQFIAFGHNEHEISQARRMAAELNMDFKVKLSWGDLYDTGDFSPVKNSEMIRRETGLGVANRNEYKKKYGKDYLTKICCLEMWHNPQINYDGKVLGCSLNYWDDYGNAFKEGLKESLNNERIDYARAMLMGTEESRADIPCTECKVYKSMQETNDWLTEKEVKESYTKSRKFIMIENKILGYDLTEKLIKILNGMKKACRKENFAPQVLWANFKSLVTAVTMPKAKLISGVYPLEVPLEPDEEKGWRIYPIFKGSTKVLRLLGCHASVLTQYTCPHAPHVHNDEETLLLLSGELDLIYSETNDSEKKYKNLNLKPGQFVYYPVGLSHTIQANSKQPANYVMFKWHASWKVKDRALEFVLYDLFEAAKNEKIQEGFRPRHLFHEPTNYLKTLHCHISTMSPGAGYEPHCDDYDVAIILLEGEVETLGRRVKPHNVIFYAAGEPHGMHNPTDVTAKYVVFEFHN